MATAIKNLTGMGTNVRQIAKLLQAKAPPGHMLAYINPEEAAFLKARGGSGRITPQGIPSFEIGDAGEAEPLLTQQQGATIPSAPQDISGGGEQPLSAAQGATIPSAPITPQITAPTTTSVPEQAASNLEAGGYVPPDVAAAVAPQGQALPESGYYAPGAQVYAPVRYSPTDLTALSAGLTPTEQFQPAAEQTPGIVDKATAALQKGLTNPETLGKLGLSAAEIYMAQKQVRNAQNQAAAAQQQQQALATPYQQQGQQLQAQALRGELTPQSQQSLQALQAQAAQGIASRGGVGELQAQNQIENLRQQLLGQQFQLGVQMSGIGDQIAIGAIKAGVQANQYVNQMTANYTANIARTLLGGLPGTTQTQSQVTQPQGY